MRILVSAASAIAVMASVGLAPIPAHARDYPFCIVGDTYNGALGACMFDTYAQCRATASGLRAFCQANPYFAELRQPPAAKRLRHHASAAQ